MYKQALQNKNIVFYLLGGGVSRLGDLLSGMAFLFFAYDLTGSGLHTTGMAIVETVPYLLFGLIGGVIADWVKKRNMLICIDLLRIPLIGSVVVLEWMGQLSYVYLLIVAFLIQTMGCFFNPAHRALLPLITKEEERTVVNSLDDSIQRGVTVVSPFLSITLLETMGTLN